MINLGSQHTGRHATDRPRPDRSVRIAWSGHRPLYFADPDAVERAIHEIAARLRRRHSTALHFVTGGQQGVDLWAAEAACALGISFEVCLPLPLVQFTADWAAPARDRLQRVIERAQALWIAPAAVNPYGERNQRLVDRADRLEVCWAGLRSGGTWDTVTRARRAGIPIRFHRFPWSGSVPEVAARGV